MHWSKQFFAVNLSKNEPKTLLDLHPTYVLKRPMAKASQGKGRGAFQTLRPLATFRPRQIPNLASVIAVPYVANLTVLETLNSKRAVTTSTT